MTEINYRILLGNTRFQATWTKFGIPVVVKDLGVHISAEKKELEEQIRELR
jgi:hypothetical protein